MQRYVLDTETVVDVLRGRADVIRRLSQVSPDQIAVTAISVAELQYRIGSTRDPERDGLEVKRFLAQIRVLPFGAKAAEQHAAIRRSARLIAPTDLLIAATALAGAAVLVTSRPEFSRVAGLKVENWRETALPTASRGWRARIGL